MAKTVLAGECLLHYLTNSATEGFVIGLIVGQTENENDNVLHLMRSPVYEFLQSGSPPILIGSSSKISSLEEFLVAEHAKCVSRLLPDGIRILGIFVIGADYILTDVSAQNKLRSTLVQIQKQLSTNKLFHDNNPSSEKILLRFAKNSKRYSCETFDLKSSNSAGQPVKWRFVSEPVGLHPQPINPPQSSQFDALLDLAKLIEAPNTMERVVFRVLKLTQSLIQCQRVQILLAHKASMGSFSRAFDFEASDLAIEESEERTTPFESRFPVNVVIVSQVVITGKTENIANAYEDRRFDPCVDENSDFVHKNILCMVIRNSPGQIIGVIQLINKLNGPAFTKNDEDFVEALAFFCGAAIHNAHLHEQIPIAMATQELSLKIRNSIATQEDAQRLNAFAALSSELKPLVDGVRENKAHWLNLAEERQNSQYRQ